MPTVKVCSQCRTEKLIAEFYKKPDSKDGFDTFCRMCRKKYFKDRYAKKFRRRPILPEGHKFCSACKKVLPIEQFDANPARYDGVQVYCRPCWLEYQRFYAKNPGQRFLTSRKVLARRRNIPEARLKDMARLYVSLAVKFGDLTRCPCETCGSKKVEAHHDDYKKPLSVRWLCRFHHNELHKGETQ